MNFDFSKIQGPKQAAQDNFELLICQLLAEEFNSISINGKGGDDGIDCFITKKNGDIEIFQMKYFLYNLTSSQKSQIKHSLITACQHNKLSRWILCIPRDHTPSEKSWFESIRPTYLVIEWWGETKIRNLLAKHPEIGRQFFLEEKIIEKIDAFKVEISELFTKRQIKSPNTLPRDIPTFIGREAQISILKKSIINNLYGSTPTVVISSIDGMPGVGKTALAIHLAHILTPQYPDAQLFIDCYGYTAGHQPLSSEQILDSLLFSLGVPIHNIPKDIDGKSALWRSELAHKKAIILIDNVKTQKQVEPILPGTSDILVLLTSRNRLPGLIGAYPLSIDVFSEKESILLIKEVVGHNAVIESFETLSEIVKHCGYLPLVLQIVAGRWRRAKSKYAKIIIEFFKESKKLIGGLQTENIAVYKVFDSSYISLTKSEKKMFQIMGIHPGPNFTTEACAAMTGMTIESTYELVESLADQSLVIEIDEGRYRLHDLLRDFSRQKHNEESTKSEEKTSIHQLIDYYLYSLTHINNILYPNQFRLEFKINHNDRISAKCSSVESALSWVEAEINNLFSCLEFAYENNWEVKYWQLSQAMANYLNRCISSWRVIQIHSNALEFAKESGVMERYASSLTELAISQNEAGNFLDALESFNNAEKSWRTLGNDAGLAYALNSKGFTLERLGCYPEAFDTLSQALKVHESIENMYGQAFTLNATGAVYWRLEKYEIALPIFIKALDIRKMLKDFGGIASTTNNIAFSHLRLGEKERARDEFLEALKIFITYHDRHGEAVVLNNLGYTAIDFRNFEAAKEYAIKARVVATKIENDYQIGRSYDVEGKAFLESGENNKACKLFQEALNIFQRLKVPETQEIQKMLSKLNDNIP